MKLPPNEDLIRDYLEWSYRRADALLAAWEHRQRAKQAAFRENYESCRRQAKSHYMLAMHFKKELNNIRDELKAT